MNILKSWETGLCMFLLAFIGLMSSCTDDEFNIRNNLETYQWYVVSYSWSSADGTDAGTVDALSKEALWAYFYEEGKGVFCDERGTEPPMEDFKWQVVIDTDCFSVYFLIIRVIITIFENIGLVFITF